MCNLSSCRATLSRRAFAQALMLGAAATATGGLLLSEEAQAQSSNSNTVIRDTEIEHFLYQRSLPVLDASGLQAERVQYYIIANNDLNAFATLGLRIGLFTGLIMECEKPNELFGVIAHEAGHLAGGHILRGEEVERAARAPMIVTLGLGIITALAGAPDAGAVMMASSGTMGTLNALQYLQSQESAADASAVRSLEAAGMSGKGIVEFFQKFRNYEVFSNAERYKFFRTHPLSRERIQALDRAVREQSHYAAVDPPEVIAEFNIVKAKLNGFLSDPIRTYRLYPETDTSYAARYARLIADYKSSHWDRALSALELLMAEQPDNPYLWELKGQIYFETGRAPLALPSHERSVELMPDAPLLRLNLAQTQVAHGNKEMAEQAVKNLNRALARESDNIFAWRLMAQAYDTLENPGMARLSTAEGQFHAGDYRSARTSAVWSQKYFEPNSPQFRRARDIVMTTSTELGVDPVDGESARRRP